MRSFVYFKNFKTIDYILNEKNGFVKIYNFFAKRKKIFEFINYSYIDNKDFIKYNYNKSVGPRWKEHKINPEHKNIM